MGKIELLKEVYKEYHELFGKMDIECVMHCTDDESEMEKEQLRVNEARKKKDELYEEYNQWKLDNDLLEQCVDWSNELFGFTQWIDEKPFYKDWATDSETYDKVMNSIHSINEQDVKDYVSNAKKALELVGLTEEKDYYEIYDYLSYIECINTNMRHGIPDGCESVFALDILENRRLWVPYRFGFDKCLENVAEQVDRIFLTYEDYDECDTWEEELSEIDDDYYID